MPDTLTVKDLLEAIGGTVDKRIDAKFAALNAGQQTADDGQAKQPPTETIKFAQILESAKLGLLVDQEGNKIDAAALMEIDRFGLDRYRIMGVPVVALGAGVIGGYTEGVIASGLAGKITGLDPMWSETALKAGFIYANHAFGSRWFGTDTLIVADTILAFSILQLLAPGIFSGILSSVGGLFSNRLSNRMNLSPATNHASGYVAPQGYNYNDPGWTNPMNQVIAGSGGAGPDKLSGILR